MLLGRGRKTQITCCDRFNQFQLWLAYFRSLPHSRQGIKRFALHAKIPVAVQLREDVHDLHEDRLDPFLLLFAISSIETV